MVLWRLTERQWSIAGKDEGMGEAVSGLYVEVLAAATRAGLSEATIAYYGRCGTAVCRYCETQSIEVFSDSARDGFVAAQAARFERGEIGLVFLSGLTKIAWLMWEFGVAGQVEWHRYRREPKALPGDFEDTLRSFRDWCVNSGLAESSTNLVCLYARQFLHHLQRSGCVELATANEGNVRRFLVAAAGKHSSGIGNVVWALKKFFGFLNRAGKSNLIVERKLTVPSPKRVRALPCFTADEVEQILAAIDTDTVRGKRDYAMACLALTTGLRACDVVRLRLEDIDWRRDEIRIIQQKTSRRLVLPLPTQAGNAIADWLLHARPKTHAPEVFVRVNRPFVGLSDAAGPNIVARWFKVAGITHRAFDGKTFHAFRRTAGTRLIVSGADLALTAQVLGHARIDSSKRYLSLHDAAMAECCLPLPGLVSTHEGLS